MSRFKEQPLPRLSQLEYYFDAVQRDRMDRSSMGRKTGEVMALRDKLLSLPDSEFEAAIRTLKNLVDAKGGDSQGTRREADRERHYSEARDLYQRVREVDESRAAPTQTISSV